MYKCCKNPKPILTRSDFVVCKNCGVVLRDKSYDYNERRTYTTSERDEKIRTCPTWRDFGPRTVLDPNEAASKRLWGRLNRVHRSMVNGIERNLWEAYPKLSKLSSKLHIPYHIQEDAKRIYTLSAKKKLTMGRSISDFVVASMYCAIRVHKYPFFLDEIVELSLSESRPIHRAIGIIVREVFPELEFTYTSVSPLEIIFRIGNKLQTPLTNQIKARNILIESLKNGLQTTGKDPKGIVGATYYIVLKSQGVTQEEIADISKVTEVTLRGRVKDIKKRSKIAQSVWTT